MKNKKQFFQRKLFYLQHFLRTNKMLFWKPCQEISTKKTKNTFVDCPQLMKNRFFSENCFTSKNSSGQKESSFDNHATNFPPGPTCVSSMSKINRKNSKKKTFTNSLSLWTGRLQFWQPYQNLIPKHWKVVARGPKMIRKGRNLQKNYCFHKITLRTPRMLSLQPSWQDFTWRPEIFLSISAVGIKHFPKMVFP